MTKGLFGGRLNRPTFWFGWTIFFVLSILFSGAATGMLFIYAAICISRLHDFGRSGWWFMPLHLPCVIGAIVGISWNIPLLTDASGLLGWAPGIWLGSMRGDESANKWGDPPPPGIMWRAPRKQPVADAFD